MIPEFLDFDISFELLAQRGRIVAAVFLLFAALFQWLAGIAAIIGGAMLWVSNKSTDALIGGMIAAFLGGAWCAYGWLGWPFIDGTDTVMTQEGFVFLGIPFAPTFETISVSQFSIFGLAGNVLLGVIGTAAMLWIGSLLKSDDSAAML